MLTVIVIGTDDAGFNEHFFSVFKLNRFPVFIRRKSPTE